MYVCIYVCIICVIVKCGGIVGGGGVGNKAFPFHVFVQIVSEYFKTKLCLADETLYFLHFEVLNSCINDQSLGYYS
jgi:hypothetical protein